MIAHLSGTTDPVTSPQNVRLKSVLINSGAGADATLVINDGVNAVGMNTITLIGTKSHSEQFHFEGVLFSNGFTVEPDSNTTFFLCEYETAS